MQKDALEHNPLRQEVEMLRARVAELEAWNEQAREAEAAFRVSGDNFRKIFDHSNDSIFIVDPAQDRIVDVNRRATEMLGYSTDELLSMPMSAIHPHDLPRLRAFASSVARNGSGWTTELSCLTKSGRKLPTEVSASLINLTSKQYLIALVRDISERKAAEAELHRANERLRADLEAAARMQQALLPSHSLVVEGLRVAWHVQPCERLGGDSLNILRLDGDHVGLYLIDVSGHGVMAAMLSVALHRFLSPFPSPTSLLLAPGDGTRLGIVPPGHVATQLNDLFPMDPRTGQYFTMFYGVLDLGTRVLRFVSAGQGAPVHVPPEGPVVELEAYDFPIGVMAGATYQEHTLHMEPGGRLYVYSDGLTDAADLDGQPFGRERVLQAIEDGRGVCLKDGVTELISRSERWTCPNCLKDDVSLLRPVQTQAGLTVPPSGLRDFSHPYPLWRGPVSGADHR